jgi:DNA polymerase elongation subunit (family B)
MKVVYGHTDSIYVKIPTVEKAQEICEEVNAHVQESFPNVMNLDNHPVQLEFEKYYKTLGVGCVKNRNAGFISWKDGYTLPEPEFIVTGFVMKRITASALEKEVQQHILKMWVREKTKQEIVKYVSDEYNKVLSGETPIENLTKRSRFNSERFTIKHICGKHYKYEELFGLFNDNALDDIPLCEKMYYDGFASSICNRPLIRPMFKTLEGKNISISSGIAGILFYNNHHENPINDSYIFMKIKSNGRTFNTPFGERKPATYISVMEQSELEEYTPDYEHYAKGVIQKAKPIFDAMNWDVNECKKDNKQRTLDDWW